MNSILDVKTSFATDESIQRYEFHSILPYSSTSLGNHDEIRIPLHQQDVLSHPAESRLYVEGTITLAASAVLGANEGLSDCAIHNLFSEIRYEVNGVIIDRSRNPGITSLMKGLVSFPTTHGAYRGNSSWIIKDNRNNKDFNFCVPLKELLGFAEDFKKVMVNVKQELVLIRSRTDNNALYDEAGNKITSLTLTTVQWQVPFVQPDDQHRLALLNVINKNSAIQVGYRTWQLYEYPNLPQNTSITWPVRMSAASEKPRFAIIGFQTARGDDKKKNKSEFDHCNVRSVRIHLGSEVFPYQPPLVDFGKKAVASLYESFVNFRKSYYYDDQGTSKVSHGEFIESYPLWVIDCSRQNEVLKSGAVDVRLEIDSKANIPAHTTAYCLLISDKLFEYVPLTGLVRELI